jgi:dihydrofolate reductase
LGVAVRKVVLTMGMGLDGIGGVGWLPSVNGSEAKEVYADMWERLKSVDTFILGGECYRLWEQIWPPLAKDPKSSPLEKEFSQFTDQIHKQVFSKKIKSVNWQNSELETGDIKDAVTRCKKQPGKDMAIVGGPKMAGLFSELGLIDEYFLWVHPVIYGQGTPLLGHPNDERPLKVVRSKVYESGLINLQLRPA